MVKVEMMIERDPITGFTKVMVSPILMTGTFNTAEFTIASTIQEYVVTMVRDAEQIQNSCISCLDNRETNFQPTIITNN